MRDPDQTKKVIVETASRLFNAQGYKATSLSDITKKSGLTKGAIYRHFQDKSSLERAALLHMLSDMMGNVVVRIKMAPDAPSKLAAIIDYFAAYGDKPPFEGGCPLMNASIEADDNNIELKAVVKGIMSEMHASVCRIIMKGKEHGQLNTKVDGSAFASLMISALEGSIMMLKVLDDDAHLVATIQFLKQRIEQMSV